MVCGSISVLGRYLITPIPVLQFITTFVNYEKEFSFVLISLTIWTVFNGCN
jgi:hypothetical protein